MKIKLLVEFLKKNKWFILFSILYIIYNLIAAIKTNFESSIFLPFRYEGLLFFKNAITSNTKAFFFIRDWSTSFLPQEHPLLYFHNLDLIHFFAGFIQYFTSSGKIILFIFSLIISIIGLWMIWKNLFHKYFNKIIAFTLMILTLVPLASFRISPQNLLITVGLLSIVWNVIILRKIFNSEILNRKLLVELFFLFLIVALTETNLTILLIIITILFTFNSAKSFIKLNSIKRILSLTGISILPIVLLRIMQIALVYFFGYINEYKLDFNYTTKLKVNPNIDILEAISFYRQNGITFFGQAGAQNTFDHFKNLTNFYLGNYGRWIWFLIIITCLLFLIINKIKFKMQLKKIINDQFQNIVFLSTYIIFFIIASYLILLLSGDAIIKVFLSKWGIFDIDVIFRAFFIMLIPTILYSILKKKINPNNFTKKVPIFCLTVLTIVFFTTVAENSILQTRKEFFSYEKVLSLIPEKSDVISNYEPSVIAIETNSRVSMSWFANLPSSCDNLNSNSLLKMFKISKDYYKNRDLYIFLVLYPPYNGGGGKDALINRHCIKSDTYTLLYEDELYLLYRYNP